MKGWRDAIQKMMMIIGTHLINRQVDGGVRVQRALGFFPKPLPLQISVLDHASFDFVAHVLAHSSRRPILTQNPRHSKTHLSHAHEVASLAHAGMRPLSVKSSLFSAN